MESRALYAPGYKRGFSVAEKLPLTLVSIYANHTPMSYSIAYFHSLVKTEDIPEKDEGGTEWMN
jgi:hypothetical protein